MSWFILVFMVLIMLLKPFEPMSYPDIREFLIDPNGKALDNLKQLEEEIITDQQATKTRYSYDDPLHQWMHTVIFEDV